MKKFILFFILFSTFILAKGTALTIKTYSTNEEISMSSIAQYISEFKVEEQENRDDEFEVILFESTEKSALRQNNIHKFTWIIIKLDENLSSGNYWIEHTDFEFIEHSFLAHQSVEKFSLFGRKIFSFSYKKTKDSKIIFLKAISSQSHVVPLASIYTAQTFSKWTEEYGINLLLSFFLFGLIFMTAIYNGALYIYNREKSFLYYMLMQIFMVIILLYETDIIQIYVMGDAENEEIAIFFYFVVVEATMVLILLFIRSFLETKKYLPFQEKILHYITIVAILDLIIFFFPIMLIFSIYSFIILYVLWVAWLRLRQGYKPALFFLFGWFAFMLGVFLSDNVDTSFLLDPLFIGSTIEALFFSVAISYKIKEIRDEKEEQKEMLVQQSRLASMGEMLGNIAHQWRQPLTRLGFILINIEDKDKQKHHEKKLEEASTQLEFMSQTIDDFRSFYEPNKKKELFSLADETQKVIEFISFENIEIELKVVEDARILNYKNEYKQVLLNLLTNAKDVLIEGEIILPKIIIEINATEVKVSDNAGGISIENIEKIFEPYFTTKEKGMGIGLYMSKMIVERNMGGKLEVCNDKEGAVFTLYQF
jgi:signal transduction histidine kinase